jgi:Tol biopolymer transport system component
VRGATIAVVVLVVTILGGSAADGRPGARSEPCPVVCGDVQPAWSPDARTIAFFHYVRAASGPRPTLAVVPAHGGPLRTVIGIDALYPKVSSGPLGPFDSISWSPDSRQLALAGYRGGIWTVSASGGSPRAIAGRAPSWSADSRRLAYETPKDLGSYRNLQLVPAEIRIADADGTSPRLLAGTDPSVAGGLWASDPVWSPADQIAYVSGRRFAGSPSPDPATAEIWTVRPDGTGAVRLVAGGGRGYRPLAWTADGQRLFFFSYEANGSALEVVDRSGSGRARLYTVRPDDIGCCQISPDGSRLAVYRTTLEGLLGLYVLDFISGSERRIAGAAIAGTASAAAWSPGGDRLAVAGGGECGPRSGVYVVPLDRARTTRLTSRCRTDGTSHADVLRGGPGPDALYGHGSGDVLEGGGGPDFLQGGAGDDVVRGGPGNDRVYGGPGRDRLNGEAGRDTIDARRGSRDVVRCGTGDDTVRADRADAVAPDCEAVFRR